MPQRPSRAQTAASSSWTPLFSDIQRQGATLSNPGGSSRVGTSNHNRSAGKKHIHFPGRRGDLVNRQLQSRRWFDQDFDLFALSVNDQRHLGARLDTGGGPIAVGYRIGPAAVE